MVNLITPMSKEAADSWCFKISQAIRVFPKGKFTVEAISSFERENAYGVSLKCPSAMREKWCETESECKAVYAHLVNNPMQARFVFDL
jgi:hypothetical protein